MARVRLAPRNPQRIAAVPIVLAEGVTAPGNTGQITVERTDSTVIVCVSNLLLAPGAGALNPLATLPVGFRSSRGFVNFFDLVSGSTANPISMQKVGVGFDTMFWIMQGDGSRTRPTASIQGQVEFVTSDAWPTT